MPEFFLELFSEEIPARMQFDAGIELSDVCRKALSSVNFSAQNFMFGPRRIAICGSLQSANGVNQAEEIKGPREGAPHEAIEGFVKKHGVSLSDLFVKNGIYFILKLKKSARDALVHDLAPALSKLYWPKSMRWAQGQNLNWIRPLRRIICLLDGEIVPIKVGPLTAGRETEGHRLYEPRVFSVSSVDDWTKKLQAHFVIADQDRRLERIISDIAAKAAQLGLIVVEDSVLAKEVNGLVEWPVSLIGKIDEKFMDLPPEVRELSMKANQKYFALRNVDGNPAPYFAFIANLQASDGGNAIVAGNERVLRARLSDAQHFWDRDLKTPLDTLLPKLEKITFHAKLGTQRERADRISALAKRIAYKLGVDDYDAAQAEWAGRLCKADLVTGMVGEFPELQGVMGGYYAAHTTNGWDGPIVGGAIRTHYQPKGPHDSVPRGHIPVSVALADKLDTLIEFFNIEEKPTGSSDPYALRRAALGVIRIILENEISEIDLGEILFAVPDLYTFILERLKVTLRGDGRRFDVIDAVSSISLERNLFFVMKRVEALSKMLSSEDGKNLLAAYKRTGNILKIETAKDGPHFGRPEPVLFRQPEEYELLDAVETVQSATEHNFRKQDYISAMQVFASSRPAVDAFFEAVTVNVPEQDIRRNRLALLARFRDTVHQIADFSKLEG